MEIIFLISLAMVGLTRTPLRKCLLRFVVFDVRMWRFID
jgi:hypothetical protein